MGRRRRRRKTVAKGHRYGPESCPKCGKVHISPNLGKIRPKLWCDNISKAKKGMEHSEKSKKNISAGLVRAYADGRMKSWNKGHTVKTHPGVAKISESNKGNIPWNKDRTDVYSEEALRIMSEARVQFYIDHPEAKLFGKDNPASRPEVRAKISRAHVGKVLSEEHKKAIGDSQRGKKLSEEVRENMSIAQIKRFKDPKERAKFEGKNNPFYGKKHLPETIEVMKKKLSILLSGENNPMWRGGVSDYRGKNWRTQRNRARERDNCVCRVCGVTEVELEQELDVHHLVPQRYYEDLEESNRLTNLVSLCHKDHLKLEGEVWTVETGLSTDQAPVGILMEIYERWGLL